MKVRYTDNGEITVPLEDVLAQVKDDDMVALVDRLSCTEAVITHVADQITDGWTVHCSNGAESYPVRAEPDTALQAARRKIAKMIGGVASGEIERLEKALEHSEARIAELQDELRSRSYESRVF